MAPRSSSLSHEEAHNPFDEERHRGDTPRLRCVRGTQEDKIVLTRFTFWLIGREIVEEIQSGEKRAEYGKQVMENLSIWLTERYGKGFSVTNLFYFVTAQLYYIL